LVYLFNEKHKKTYFKKKLHFSHKRKREEIAQDKYMLFELIYQNQVHMT